MAWIVRALFSHSVEEYVLAIGGLNPTWDGVSIVQKSHFLLQDPRQQKVCWAVDNTNHKVVVWIFEIGDRIDNQKKEELKVNCLEHSKWPLQGIGMAAIKKTIYPFWIINIFEFITSPWYLRSLKFMSGHWKLEKKFFL